MSEENKNNEGLNEEASEGLNLTPETPDFLPEVELSSNDGIEVISDDTLENYADEPEAEQEFDLTVEELKKLLRIKMKNEGNKTPITEEMVDALTEDEIGELKEIAKIRDRKALLRFANRTKNVTDEEAKNLTDEEFLDLTNKALVMSRFLNYNTKKDFGVKYKKKRQNKNNMAKRSRAANRK